MQRDFRAIVDNDSFIPQITPYLQTLVYTVHKARVNHEKYQEHSKFYADNRRRPSPNFHCGDKVLVDAHVLSKSKNLFTFKLARVEMTLTGFIQLFRQQLKKFHHCRWC